MARDTRHRILVASLLLFNEHGVPRTTINEIADEIDISPGNLNYHFRRKSDIVDALTAEFQEQMYSASVRDPLTEVYNRGYLNDRLAYELGCTAGSGVPLSLVMIDLDRFKLVNDRHGHLIGSETLRVLSRLLRECVRQVDTLARYGGDEFTILLVDTPHDVALRVAERIRSRVEKHLFEAGRDGSRALFGEVNALLRGEIEKHGTDELKRIFADYDAYYQPPEGADLLLLMAKRITSDMLRGRLH